MAILFEFLYLDLIAACAVIFGLLYWYFTSTFNYWKDKGVPYLEPTAFFGNIKDQLLMRTSSAEIYQRFYQELDGHKFGGVFSSRRPTLILRDPELIKKFMVKDFSHFHDRGLPVDKKNNPLSEHLFNLEGTKWRKLRVKLTPTFTSGKMKLMFPVINECALELREYLKDSAENGESLELKEVLAKFTTDVIGTCAFGLQFNSMKDPDSEFRIMGRKVFEPTIAGFLRRVLQIIVPSIASVMKVSFPPKPISDFFLKAVKETVDYREKNNVKRNDFMQLLIQIKNKGKVEDDHESSANGDAFQNGHIKNGKEADDFEMSDNLLAAQAFVFFLAGFETSSTTMSYCLHELAVNPDIQHRLQQEIDAVLQETGGEITYEALQKMEYLDKVVAETLRKYPPVGNLFRKCTKPYTIPDTDIVIDEGIRVFIPAFALHRDPKHYPDPERFDPERFSEENKAKRHHYVYLPFGEGPRICIGMRFGQMQTKVGQVALLSHYNFKVCRKTAIPLLLDPRVFVTTSFGGTWLQITNRT